MEKELGGGGEGPYGGGGAGGKFRTSRSARRAATTPYDRPQTGRHAPASVRAAARGNSGSWLSRMVVDPASRLINNGAVKWFNSVFRNRTLPPPAPSSSFAHIQEVQEDSLQDVEEEAVENAMVTEVIDQEREIIPVENQRSESELVGLEQLLKNKTLSREEFNRLIGVLQSRVVDGSPGIEDHEVRSWEELNGGNEPSNVRNAEAQRWREERKKAREDKDNSSWGNGLCSTALTPAVTGNVCDDAGSSPADIAKAFMGVRSHRASTSILPLQRRPFGDGSTPNRLFRDVHTPNRRKTHQLAPRTTEGLVFGNGQVEDRLKTPSNRLNSPQFSRAQSRVQGHNYTPYAISFRQQAGAENIGDGTPISTPASRWTPIQSPLTGGRQMLKKRSGYVLDDNLTSAGPIRSIRQKTSFYTPMRNYDPSCSTGNQLNPLLLHANDSRQNGLASVFRKPMEMEKKNDVLSAFQSQEEATRDLSANLACVPQQSSETARKILEHLERMVPSPKEKSAEAQLAIARAKSPTRLNVSMLNGHARRSTETVDRIPFLEMHGHSSFPLQENNQLGAQEASGSQKKYEGNGKSPMFNSMKTSGEAPTSSGTGDVALLDALPTKVDPKLPVLDGSLIVPEKKRGFRMSAPEESDDEGVSRNDTMLINSQTGNGTFASQGNIADIKTLKGDKAVPSVSSLMTTKAEANTRTSATSVVVESSTNSPGFSFPVGSASGNFTEPPTPMPMPSPLSKGKASSLMDNTAPTYNFGSASTSKGPVFSFPTSGCTDVDTTKPEFDFKFESKPEESFSTAVAAAASTLPLQTSSGSLESPASIFNGGSASGFSGNLSSVPSSSTIFSTSTTVAIPALGIPLIGGPISKTDSISSVPFSSPETYSAKATLANNNSCLTASSPNIQGGASSFAGTENLVRSFIGGDKSTVNSESDLKASNLSPRPSLFGVTKAVESTEIISGTSNSKSNLLPNSQSAFAGSLFGQASSSAAATASVTFVFGSSASLGSLSSSLPSESLFFSSSAVSFGSTIPPLFGSTTSASVSSFSASSFGSSAPSSSTSCSLPSFGLSSNAFGTNTSASLFSGSTAAGGTGTTTTFGTPSNLSLGSSGTSFAGSSAPFGLGSTTQFGSNMSPLFGLSTTPQFGSDTSPSFGLSTTPQFGSNTSPSFGSTNNSQFVSNTSPSFGSGVTFGENASSSCFALGSRPSSASGNASTFNSVSTFGSGSSSFGGSSSPFAPSSTPALGGSSASFGSGGVPVSGGSSSLFGSASTPVFGSNSNPPFGLAQSFGASSAASSSQSTATSFGSGFGVTPASASGFSFGGSVAASSGSFTFGASGNTSSGPAFSFNSTSGAPPSAFTFGAKDISTLPQQSIFAMTNASPTFGATASTQSTDQMEDSMAEDPAQVSSPPVFGGQSASSAPAFMFSSQPSAPLPGQSVFQFGSQPSPAAANPFAAGGQSTFTPPAGGLEFSGGSFSLGAGGEKPGRKFIKAKRDKGRRK